MSCKLIKYTFEASLIFGIVLIFIDPASATGMLHNGLKGAEDIINSFRESLSKFDRIKEELKQIFNLNYNCTSAEDDKAIEDMLALRSDIDITDVPAVLNEDFCEYSPNEVDGRRSCVISELTKGETKINAVQDIANTQDFSEDSCEIMDLSALKKDAINTENIFDSHESKQCLDAVGCDNDITNENPGMNMKSFGCTQLDASEQNPDMPEKNSVSKIDESVTQKCMNAVGCDYDNIDQGIYASQREGSIQTDGSDTILSKDVLEDKLKKFDEFDAAEGASGATDFTMHLA